MFPKLMLASSSSSSLSGEHDKSIVVGVSVGVVVGVAAVVVAF